MRKALNSILHASNWEAIPVVPRSLNGKFHEALSKEAAWQGHHLGHGLPAGQADAAAGRGVARAGVLR